VSRPPGVVRLLDRLPAVVGDDLRTVEPLEVRLVTEAQLLDDVLLRARGGRLLRVQLLEERPFGGDLVDRIILEVEIQTDLSCFGDLTGCEWNFGFLPFLTD
jgi:hypothetical protein